ncbi:MAG: carboxypeptidase-like regulatory domain-containing protein, partial [Gemmata sp.]
MNRARTGLIVAALLVLAGCKSTDSKGEDRPPPGLNAKTAKAKDGRDTKDPRDKDAKGALAKGPAWLDGAPKGGVPKSTGPTNPKDPNFDAKTAAQDALGGRVLDPYGRPARNVYVRIEPVGCGGPGEIGLNTDDKGYFFAKGLQVGQSYDVTATATPQEGKPLTGTVQTKVPNVILTIQLRDDLPTGGAFPPAPRPADKVGDYIPPTGYAPTRPKVPGDAWSPGGPTNAVPPATIGGAKPPAVSGPAPGAIPPPE